MCSGDDVVKRYAEGESIRQIAARSGLSRPIVRSVLARAGVEVAPYGRGRPRPHMRTVRPDGIDQALEMLYTAGGLTRRQVAESLRVPEHRVRAWLESGHLARRTRGWANREDRQRLDRQTLLDLYVESGLTAAEVGERTGAPLQKVLAALHDNGLPVRIHDHTQNRSMILLDLLYQDTAVREALDRHRVPVRAQPGKLHERFPAPVPLTPELLRDLYTGCGLSVVHIEMLTGQPAATVTRLLKRAEVRLRPAGGLSPFLRRHRGLDRE
jgi:transposase